MYFGLVARVGLEHMIDFWIMHCPGRIGRIVAKRRILDEMPHHIDPKSVDSAPQPETQGLMHRGAHVSISPIQIRLLRKIGVVVILACAFIPCPGATTKVADPIIRRTTALSRIPPDIPIAFWICT